MDRVFQFLLIGGTIGFSWPAMMAVHELGHVLHAWASGGKVRQVVVPLVGFSRTDLAENPHMLFVAWGGALWGVLLPLVAWILLRRLAPRYAFLAAFFTGFCLVVNGAYIGAGAWFHAGDAADLLRAGARPRQLLFFGVPSIAAGLWLWHGLGPSFGLRQPRGAVDRRAALVALLASVGVLAAVVILGGE